VKYKQLTGHNGGDNTHCPTTQRLKNEWRAHFHSIRCISRIPVLTVLKSPDNVRAFYYRIPDSETKPLYSIFAGMKTTQSRLKTELIWISGIFGISVLLLVVLSRAFENIAFHDTYVVISVLGNLAHVFLFLSIMVFLVKEAWKGFKSFYGCLILSVLFIASALYMIQFDVTLYQMIIVYQTNTFTSGIDPENLFQKQLQQLIIFQCLLLLAGLLFGYRSWRLRKIKT
jgi:hypothetical protein